MVSNPRSTSSTALKTHKNRGTLSFVLKNITTQINAASILSTLFTPGTVKNIVWKNLRAKSGEQESRKIVNKKNSGTNRMQTRKLSGNGRNKKDFVKSRKQND